MANQTIKIPNDCPVCSYENGQKVKMCENCLTDHTYELCEHFGSRREKVIARRCADCQQRIDEVFDSFWRDIVTGEDGELDAEKVKGELFDFHHVITSVSKVYDSLTGGKLSKPNYLPEVVIGEVEQRQNDEISEAAGEAVADEIEEILAFIEQQTEYYKLNRNAFGLLKALHEDIETGKYKPAQIKPEAELEPDFTFCQNCQKATGITKNFRCTDCGENICVKCGCTDSAACAEICDWTSPGHCSSCFPGVDL